MYTIGEFSSISGMPKKTLRYYDDIELLVPARINKENGYRLYSKNQITIAAKILKYKEFGLSLSDIKNILYSDSKDQLDELLKIRISTIELEIKRLKEQKQSIKRFNIASSDKIISDKDFVISNTSIDGGYILQSIKPAEQYDIHELITHFYNVAANENISLLSSHYFRQSILSEEHDENIEIFAFAEYTEKSKLLKKIDKVDALMVTNVTMDKKGLAYAQIIDFAKQQSIKLSAFIENYSMNKGRLSINIYGVIS